MKWAFGRQSNCCDAEKSGQFPSLIPFAIGQSQFRNAPKFRPHLRRHRGTRKLRGKRERKRVKKKKGRIPLTKGSVYLCRPRKEREKKRFFLLIDVTHRNESIEMSMSQPCLQESSSKITGIPPINCCWPGMKIGLIGSPRNNPSSSS